MTTTNPFLYFQFTDAHGTPRNLQFRDAVNIYTASTIDEVIHVLGLVQEALAQGYYAAGYVSYEAAPAFDPAYKVSTNSKLPLVWFGIYNQPLEHELPYSEGSYTVSNWSANTSRESYQHSIQAVREAIARGDTYQTNYTIRLRSEFTGDDLAYYQRLSSAQSANYAAYVNIGRFRLLSVSPELFFRKEQNRVITRPMKGTIKRGKTIQEDQLNRKILSDSIKERAENVMIVDLLRNDLSKVATIGSVTVPELFTIEAYPTVLQMTSTVEAEVAESTSIIDLFTALFPCGSITGAPKVSTMQLIDQLEADPREVYCGAIGYIEPNGNAIFNVAIRTVIVDNEMGTAEYGVGGGITWDSTATGEYDEVLTKAKILTEEIVTFDLLESIKLDQGNYVLLDKHLERLESSANYFGYRFSKEQLVILLQEHANKYPTQMQKVRVLLSKVGQFSITSEEIQQLESLPQQIILAESPIARQNKFLYHKTTNRSEYVKHRGGAEHYYDVLLWNEEGELTEFTNGNLVMEIDGQLCTPPINSGLLAGTFRAQLLEDGVIQERVLTLDDYALSNKLWFINSVRGWVPVTKN